MRGRREAVTLMAMSAPSTPLSTPPFIPQIRLYQHWLQDRRGLQFADYDALWRWSITDLDAFWQSLWDYYDLQSPTPHTAVLAERRMPGARWFPGAQVNYAAQALRHVAPAADAAGQPAVISHGRQKAWAMVRRAC
jgi:acetoacetyl-CoA synthetase